MPVSETCFTLSALKSIALLWKKYTLITNIQATWVYRYRKLSSNIVCYYSFSYRLELMQRVPVKHHLVTMVGVRLTGTQGRRSSVFEQKPKRALGTTSTYQGNSLSLHCKDRRRSKYIKLLIFTSEFPLSCWKRENWL